MTLKSNSRIAGFTFLFYIVVAIFNMSLYNRATGGEGTLARLAQVGAHATELGISIILDLLCCFCALVLAVSLYSITRNQNRDLAMMGMACRIGEGVIAAANLPKTLALLWLATGEGGTQIADASIANALGTFLLVPVGSSGISAIFFAVGSTIFSCLLLRGRMVPVFLAWLGVAASILLVAVLPIQLAGFVTDNWYIWMPMLIFEVVLAVWLIVKGAASPVTK